MSFRIVSAEGRTVTVANDEGHIWYFRFPDRYVFVGDVPCHPIVWRDDKKPKDSENQTKSAETIAIDEAKRQKWLSS